MKEKYLKIYSFLMRKKIIIISSKKANMKKISQNKINILENFWISFIICLIKYKLN